MGLKQDSLLQKVIPFHDVKFYVTFAILMFFIMISISNYFYYRSRSNSAQNIVSNIANVIKAQFDSCRETLTIDQNETCKKILAKSIQNLNINGKITVLDESLETLAKHEGLNYTEPRQTFHAEESFQTENGKLTFLYSLKASPSIGASLLGSLRAFPEVISHVINMKEVPQHTLLKSSPVLTALLIISIFIVLRFSAFIYEKKRFKSLESKLISTSRKLTEEIRNSQENIEALKRNKDEKERIEKEYNEWLDAQDSILSSSIEDVKRKYLAQIEQYTLREKELENLNIENSAHIVKLELEKAQLGSKINGLQYKSNTLGTFSTQTGDKVQCVLMTSESRETLKKFTPNELCDLIEWMQKVQEYSWPDFLSNPGFRWKKIQNAPINNILGKSKDVYSIRVNQKFRAFGHRESNKIIFRYFDPDHEGAP